MTCRRYPRSPKRAVSCAGWVVLVLWLAGGPHAAGQIDISCRLRHGKVLQYEPVLATLAVANETLQPIEWAPPDGEGRISFDVEEASGGLLLRTEDPLLKEPFMLAPQEESRRTFNLQTAYGIRRLGQYTIRARVGCGGRVFVSPKLFLDVESGLEIARLVAGVPGDASAMRTYTLRTLHRDGGERIFLRITDEEQGMCYGVVELGRLVRFFEPVIQIDFTGNVHVLHQSGPTQFTHSVVMPNGYLVLQEQYLADVSRIRIKRTEGGQVVVEGAEPVSTAPRGPE